MRRSPAQETQKICLEIGENIKNLRKVSGLSLQELARRTGFAKSYLSQIENSRREPPISTLTKIAYILGVDVMFLITGHSDKEEGKLIGVVRAGERRRITRASGPAGYDYQSVAYGKKDRLMDAYIVTPSFEFPPEPRSHEGEELIFILEGRQEFVYQGKKYVLEEGDCVYYDSGELHYSRSLGERPAKLLVVYTSKT